MTKLINIVKSFTSDESGAAMVEYSILIGLISALVILLIVFAGEWVNTAWITLTTALNGGVPV